VTTVRDDDAPDPAPPGSTPLTDEALQELIVGDMPTVLSIVKQYTAQYRALVRKSNLKREDLIAIGSLALSNAAPRFVPGPGRTLGSFAWLAIYGAIKDAVKGETKHGRAIHAGMSRSVGVDREDQDRYGQTSQGARDEAVQHFSNAMVAGMLMSLAAADPEHEAMDDELHHQVRQAVAELAPKDDRLIRLHYFEDQTLLETGAALGMSRSTVKRRHKSILKRIGARLVALGVAAVPA
jgi:RNA polymerase sigma factor (sigma-70 family)